MQRSVRQVMWTRCAYSTLPPLASKEVHPVLGVHRRVLAVDAVVGDVVADDG